jgi:hypothetical protein
VSDDDTLELGADVRAMHHAEQSMAMRAFRSLPERWQAVLWHTEIEDESPSEVATLFGLDANGTRVLASRAREGLKQAYLQAHVSATLTGDEECARYADQLGTYARGRLRTRAERGLRKHLDECAKCRLAALQIEEVAGGIPAVVPVAVIGWFGAAGYAKAAGLIAGGAGAAGAAGAAAGAGGSAAGASGSAGGAAAGGGGSVGGSGGAVASEGVGAPVKAGVAAGVVTVGVVAAVVMALAGNEKPKPEAEGTPSPPTPSSVARPGEPTPTPSPPPSTPPSSTRPGPGPRPPEIVSARAQTPAPAPSSRTSPSPEPDPDPTPTRAPAPPPESPRPTPPPAPTPTPTPPPPPPAPAVYQWSELSYDISGDGTKPEMRIGSSSWVWKRSGLSVGAQRYAHGVTVHGRSSVTIDLNRPCLSYDALVGVDDMTLRLGKVYFSVYADGVRLWRSPLVEGGDPAVPVHVNLAGRSTVRLVVEPRSALDNLMPVDWAESRFTCG